MPYPDAAQNDVIVQVHAAPPEVRPEDSRTVFFVAEPDRGRLAELAQRLREGRLTPIVGDVRTLADAPAAFAPDRRTPGKTIIRVIEDRVGAQS